MTQFIRRGALGVCMLTALMVANPVAVRADEGMWTLDNFPSALVKERHGVSIDEEWLARVQSATVRLEGGCTGSFVSPDGLILTNHHCVRRCLSRLSTADRNLEEDGFLARSRADEEQCAADQVSVLVDTDEITAQVEDEVHGKPEAAANEARKRLLTRLEQECESSNADGPPVWCEAVSLYNGGQHFLYKYRRYDDVRMVFAPESPIAAFGGDPDNFNFPRWCLDMAFMRAYENGKPASTPDHLRWRPEGPDPGEAVFVSGHPGSTERLLTTAELAFRRDVSRPLWLLRYSELRGRLIQHGKTGDEAQRIIQSPLLSIENALKVRRKELDALHDPDLFRTKRAEEEALMKFAAGRKEFRDAAGAWKDIEGALETYRAFYEPHLFLEQRGAFDGSLFFYARALVRAAVERTRPNEERLRAYTESALPQLQQRVLAPRPIYPDLEKLRLSWSLDKMREWLGPDHALVKTILGAKSPDRLAEELVDGTRLQDADFRRSIWEGGMDAIATTDDPVLRLARDTDEQARALRKRYEDSVESVINAASERIARVRFAREGTTSYPDATFTLRVTFGAVEGWMEKGEQIPPFTRLSVLYDRTTGADPFRLPEQWIEARSKLKPDTPFNYVATTDITGGNSGSPVVDAQARLVGLAFDGNIHSIAGDYWFDPEMNRTVAVHPAIMVEALKKIYGAEDLLKEIGLR